MGEAIHESKPFEATSDQIQILHDFGMLRPDERVSHSFEVKNPTDEDWTLEKVVQNCTCSVASASSSNIKAGDSEFFKFDYHAPTKFADERRSVSLMFRGKVARQVDLVITAWVRPEMALRSTGLNFGNLPVGGSGRRSVEVGNFGPANWTGLDVEAIPRGLSILRSAKVERPWEGVTPRETWAVDVQVDCGALSTGAFRDEIQFRAASGAKAALPVEFVVGVPVVARPSLFMLGQVERSRPIEASTTLKFFGGRAPCSPDQVEVRVGGLKLISKQITIVGRDTWKLVVTVELSEDTGEYVSGRLTIAFPKGNPSDVTIPIDARIVPKS